MVAHRSAATDALLSHEFKVACFANASLLNTQLMQGYWSSHASSSGPVTMLDLDASASTDDSYADLKSQFVLAKQITAAAAVAQGATDGGAAAVRDVYHAGLVPPFCLSAVRSFFASH